MAQDDASVRRADNHKRPALTALGVEVPGQGAQLARQDRQGDHNFYEQVSFRADPVARNLERQDQLGERQHAEGEHAEDRRPPQAKD